MTFTAAFIKYIGYLQCRQSSVTSTELNFIITSSKYYLISEASLSVGNI